MSHIYRKILIPLFLIAIFGFANASGASGPDVNVTLIDSYADNSGLPTFSYYRDINLTITFTVSDRDDNRLTVDMNYSASAVGGTGTVIRKDVNLTTPFCTDFNFQDTTTCTLDFNIVSTSVSDGNYYILMMIYDAAKGAGDLNTNFEASNNTFMVDNTRPKLTHTDFNAGTWMNVDVNARVGCTDAGSNCKTLYYKKDTDSSNTASYPATWTTFDGNVLDSNFFYTADGNWGVQLWVKDTAGNDSNSTTSDMNVFFVLVDKTAAASLAITNAVPCKTTANSILLGYSATDVNAGIKIYWVSGDSTNWINNSTNTSYTFSIDPSTSLPVTKTYYVKVQDNADNNSASVSIACTYESGSGGTTGYCGDSTCQATEDAASCPEDCKPSIPSVICGDGICDEPSGETSENCPADCGAAPGTTVEIILEKTISKKPTAERIREILTEAGASETAIEKASAAVGKTTVERKITVKKITDAEGNVSYTTTVTITVENPGKKKFKKVKIIENLPKSVAFSASEIKSKYEFEILKDDPLIRFGLDQINNQEIADIIYVLDKQVTLDQATGWTTLPIVSEFEEEEVSPVPIVSCSTEADCDDGNPCTTDRCTANKCSLVKLPDNATCGFGKECIGGVCTAIGAEGAPSQDATIIVVIAIIILVAAYAYFKYLKPK